MGNAGPAVAARAGTKGKMSLRIWDLIANPTASTLAQNWRKYMRYLVITAVLHVATVYMLTCEPKDGNRF